MLCLPVYTKQYVVAHAKIRFFDQAHHECQHAIAVQAFRGEIFIQALAELRQVTCKAAQALKLGFALLCLEVGVIPVLPPSRLVDADGLQRCVGIGRDLHVVPSGRNS